MSSNTAKLRLQCYFPLQELLHHLGPGQFVSTRFTSDKQLMSPFANNTVTQLLAWGLFGLISAANLALMYFWVS